MEKARHQPGRKVIEVDAVTERTILHVVVTGDFDDKENGLLLELARGFGKIQTSWFDGKSKSHDAVATFVVRTAHTAEELRLALLEHNSKLTVNVEDRHASK